MNAAVTGRDQLTNARSEEMNSKIQWIKRMACGYRNRTRFTMRFTFTSAASTSTRSASINPHESLKRRKI